MAQLAQLFLIYGSGSKVPLGRLLGSVGRARIADSDGQRGGDEEERNSEQRERRR